MSAKRPFVYIFLFVSLLLISSSPEGSAVTAQENGSFIRQARVLEMSDLGILNPSGLAFSPAANAFYLIESGQAATAATDIIELTATARRLGTARISAAISDPINMTFDGRYNRLLLFKAESNQLIEVFEDADGNLDPATLTRHDARHLGLVNPQGMAVDPDSGSLFILDSATSRILRIQPEPDGSFDDAVLSVVAWQSPALANPRGLALDPATGHFHIVNPAEQKLYELTQTGEVVTSRDLAEFELANPQSILFAPSGDLTDDPSQMSLYLAENAGSSQEGTLNMDEARLAGSRTASGAGSTGSDTGEVHEFSFVEPTAITADTYQSSLVQTINAFEWDPPSPDASGVVYMPDSDSLMVVDGEVNEMNIYAGANVFEASLTGILTDTWNTLSFSNEPTGVTVNPADGHLFISQDTRDRFIHEIDAGADGEFGTADDVVTSIVTADFGSNDPEGVTYAAGLGVIFLADGVNNEIYRIDPGANGIFDGVSPSGDDQVTSFDTSSLGLQDPEGVAYNPDNGNLYISGNSDTSLLEVTVDGVLVQAIDVSAANATRLSGLGYGPSSVDPGARVVYIADRGIDNGADPNENDGKVYEMALPIVIEPTPPSAGDDSASTIENVAVTIDVAANDTDINGNLDPATINTACDTCTVPTGGSLANNGDGTFTYTPNTGFTGSDGFIYEICDTESLCDPATVSITVEANQPPTANDDRAGTGVDISVLIDVAANDTDSNGNLDPTSTNTNCDTCTVPTGGSLANNGDGIFTYSPDPGFSGFDGFVYQICDTVGACDTATVTISVDNIVEVRVSAGDDDAEEQEDLSVGLTSSDLELVLEDSNQTVGMRFAGIDIPWGVTITGAYIQFQADETNSEATSLTIQGEAADDALTFADVDGNVSSRLRTTAAVSWTPGPWTAKGQAGPEQRTPDLAPVIQEIVGRPGWKSGNALALIITGSGKRVADSYNGDPAGAPLLHVEYTRAGNTPPGIVIDTPSNGSTHNAGNTINFSGTALDSEDGDLSASLSWESDLDGAIGSGNSFSRSDLSTGVHTIVATVTDSGGETAIASATITVFAPANVLVGAGDIAMDGPNDEETARLLDTIPGIVFTLGDNAYPDGSDAEFSDYYDPTWGRHKARTYPAVGNHDYHQIGASGYFNYFGAAAGDPDKGYYSYDLGDWHIIVLNSECEEVGGCEQTSPQGQWLQADLAANPAACTLAYWHEPRFSSGISHSSEIKMQDFWQLLYDAGADVVFNGHEHNYERFALQDPTGAADPGRGIRQFVVGTGGIGLSTFGSPLPNSEVRNDVAHGVLKLTLNPTGYDWEFIPISGQTFTDSGSAECVSPASSNEAPVAVGDAYTTDEDALLSVAAPGVLGNDSDADGDLLTAVLEMSPSNGTLTFNADGSFGYTPDSDFSGSDTFSYRVNDGTTSSDVATVTITVAPVNDAPVAADDAYITNEDTTLSITAPGVLANDGDVDGDALTAVVDAAPVNGSLVLNGDGSFNYTPDAEFSGTDTFSYHASDGTTVSDVATVNITVGAINDPPAAVDDAYVTDEDTVLTVVAPGVLANDSDAENDSLTALLSAGTLNGSVTFNGDGSFSYTPNADFNGSDEFTYQASDGLSGSNPATVTITVNAVDDAPVAAGDAYATNEDTTLNADGSFTYTPDAAFTGTDTFSYQANDGTLDSNVATVTITVQATSLAVTGITPDSAPAGSTVAVTISGSGFQDGATLALENGQGPAPDILNLVVVDASTLTATFSIKQGGPPRDRPWDVRVTNPDGQTDVLVAGFTVTLGTAATTPESTTSGNFLVGAMFRDAAVVNLPEEASWT